MIGYTSEMPLRSRPVMKKQHGSGVLDGSDP